jgi:hypothetical protein
VQEIVELDVKDKNLLFAAKFFGVFASMSLIAILAVPDNFWNFKFVFAFVGILCATAYFYFGYAKVQKIRFLADKIEFLPTGHSILLDDIYCIIRIKNEIGDQGLELLMKKDKFRWLPMHMVQFEKACHIQLRGKRDEAFPPEFFPKVLKAEVAGD